MKKKFVFMLLGWWLVCTTLCSAQIWVINTFAGNGVSHFGGDDSLAKLGGLVSPSGVATDRHGNVYIADQNNSRVRKVDTSGIITTIAGIGVYGYSGDSGPATIAKLSGPTGVAVDKHGNVYIADEFNNVIRKIDPAGTITTFAGNDTLGFGGDSGLAIHAEFWSPSDVAVDTFGNVYITDQDNNRVRKVDTSGIITTIAGDGTAGYAGDSAASTAARLNFPQGIAVDRTGNVYIADFYNSRIRKIDVSTGIITTVAGNGTGGYGGDDSLAINAEIYDASAVAVDDSNNIYISDYYNNRVRKVTAATGIITTVAGNGIGGYTGDDSLATSGEIFYPQGVAVDTSGNIFVADFNNHVVREVSKIDTSTLIACTRGNESTAGFVVFPNPSQGKFFAEIKDQPIDCEIAICDILGKIICRFSHCKSLNEIDLSDFQDNIYVVYLRCEKNSCSRKVIIQH